MAANEKRLQEIIRATEPGVHPKDIRFDELQRLDAQLADNAR
jgi:hypothetical protein